MGIRGTGRKVRAGFADELAERDPELAAALAELRRSHPQAYRKRLRALARLEGRRVPTGGLKLNLGPTPGRATDPALAAAAPVIAPALELPAPVAVPEPAQAPEPAAAAEDAAPKKKRGKKGG